MIHFNEEYLLLYGTFYRRIFYTVSVKDLCCKTVLTLRANLKQNVSQATVIFLAYSPSKANNMIMSLVTYNTLINK